MMKVGEHGRTGPLQQFSMALGLVLATSCNTSPPASQPGRLGDLELRITRSGASLHRGADSVSLESGDVGLAPLGEGSADALVAVSRQWDVREPLDDNGVVTRRGTTKLYLVAAGGLELEEVFEFESLKAIKYSGGGWETTTSFLTLHDINEDGRYEIQIGHTNSSSTSVRGRKSRTYFHYDPGQQQFVEAPYLQTRLEPTSDVSQTCAKALGFTCEFLEDERLDVRRRGFGDVGNLRAYLGTTSDGALAVVVARENKYMKSVTTLDVRRVGKVPSSVPEHPQNPFTQTWSADGLTPAVVVRHVRGGELYARAYPWVNAALGEPTPDVELDEDDCVTVHPQRTGPPKLTTKTCEEEQPPREKSD